MTYKEHFQRNIILAYPVMFSQIGQVLVGLADNLMVARVNVVSLASASLANSIFYFVFTFGLGMSYAITPLVARADSKKDYAESSKILKHGVITNIATGLILSLLVVVFIQFIHHLNQPPEVVKLAIPYLYMITFSLIPYMLFQSLRQFCEGLSMTKIPMYTTIVANLINIGLNYILIFGKFGFPQMGLLGAGVATLVARSLMAIIIFLYIRKSEKFQSYWKHYHSVIIKKETIRKLLNIGIPAGLQFTFEIGAFAMAAIMAGWLGTIPLAAHQIAINLCSISYMMATGIASAATIRAGNQMGLKDIPTLIKVGKSSFFMSAVIMISWALFFILGNNWLPTLYVDEMPVILLSGSLLVIAAFFQVSDGLQVVGLGVLRGMEDVKMPTLITLIAYWIFGLPISYLLGFVFDIGIQGIWIGLLIGLSVSAFSLIARFNRLVKQKLKIYMEI